MDDLATRLRAMAATPGMSVIGAGLSAYQEREMQRLLVEAAACIAELGAELKRIEENLGEYIDRVGIVDVAVALAFETARASTLEPQP